MEQWILSTSSAIRSRWKSSRIAAASASNPDASPASALATTIIAAQNDLVPLDHQPSFEPDYNNLTAQPWVEPVTTQTMK